MNKKVSRSIQLYLDGKQIEGSVKGIRAEMRKLTGELNKMKVGTKEYQEKTAEISKQNAILGAHKKEVSQVSSEFLSLREKVSMAFQKFKDGAILSLALGKALPGLGAISEVFSKAIDAGRWWNEYNVEVEETQRLTHEFLGLTGTELTHVQTQISVATAKSLDFFCLWAYVDT